MRGTARGALLVGCALLLACAGRRAPLGSFVPGNPGEEGAARVVLLDEEVIRFRLHPDTGEAAMEVTTRLHQRFLDPRAGQPRSLVASYLRGFSRVERLRARVIDQDGEVTEADQSEIFDVPLRSTSILYSDGRAKVLPHAAIPRGGLLETEHVELTRDMRMFQQGFQFGGGGSPTRLARLVVETPAGWEAQVHLTRGDVPVALPPTDTTEVGGVTRQIWEQRDVPKARSEPGSPVGHAQLVARVRLVRWRDAKGPQAGFEGPVALSAFLAELMAQPEDLPELEAQTRELLAGLEDAPARAKAERLHAFVAQEVRYCAIELGIHGWKPHPPSKVLGARAGDCKDKAGLLKALLGHAGIPSRVAVLYSHDGHPRPFFVPTVAGNANHAILLVDLPDGTVPVDPTEPHVPFGQLPPRDQGAELLPVTSPGSPLWRSPEDGPESQHEEQHLRLKLASDGAVTGDFTAKANGTSASRLRAGLRGASERLRREAIDAWLPVRRARTLEASVEGERLPAQEVSVQGRLSVGRFLLGDGGTRLFRTSELLGSAFPAPSLEPRTLPLALRHALSRRQVIHLALPPGERAHLPASSEVTSPFGSSRLQWRMDGAAVVVEREQRLTQRAIPVAQWPAFQTFLREVALQDDVAAVLIQEAAAP